MRKTGNPGRQLAPRVALFTFGLIVLGTAAQAQQPTQAQIDGIKSNCRSDYMSNCLSVKPGGSEALQCLKKNIAKLSAGCKTAVNSIFAPPASAAPAVAPVAPAPTAAAKSVESPPQQAAPIATPQPPATPTPASPAVATPTPANSSAATKSPAAAALPLPQKPVTRKKPAVAAAPPPPPAPIAAAPPPPDPAILMAKAEHMPLPKRMEIFRACNQDQAMVCPTIKPGGGRLIVCLAQNSDALSPYCRRTLAGALQ